MKHIIMLFFIGTFCAFGTPFEDWGATGHRATGEIAEQYLNRRAKKEIARLLNGESLAFVSTYGDEIKSDEKYRKYGPWHYVNFPFDSTYENHPKNERGDVIQGIDKCLNVLKDKNSTQEDKVFYLKMLVHFIGDLHQPLHVGLGEDRGGNDFQVRWFDNGTNLHRVWDTDMIEHYNMSYTELARNADQLSKEELSQIEQGTVIDWMYESKTLCKEIYNNVKPGQKLSYKYRYEYLPVVRKQLQKGGIRLAVLLNDIFG